jgi:DNA-binding CsgD family transcriptional regulator
MDRLTEILTQRCPPGVILFDTKGMLRYANQEARELLPSLRLGDQGEDKKGLCLPVELAGFVDNMVGGPIPDSPFSEPFLYSAVVDSSWGLPLSLRGFLLRPSDNRDGNHQYLVLVEMIAEKREINLLQIQKEFTLTNREAEVLKLAVAGCSNQEISEKLFVSIHTVKDHLKHLKEKMGVPSRKLLVATIINR